MFLVRTLFNLIILSTTLTYSYAYYLPTNNIAPTLVISLDGLRADKLDKFLNDNPNSALKKYIFDYGVKAKYMIPVFPTVSFPSHFTIVTGLYPEEHDIVENRFYDASYNLKINLLSDDDKLNVRWWNKTDPVWLTARNQGLKTASLFWLGSDVWTRNPDIFIKSNNDYGYKERSEEIASLFLKFNLDLAFFYFNEPDLTGHYHGPDSDEYYEKIVQVDDALGHLFGKLNEANLLDNMNVIVLSDHGMTNMNKNPLLVQDYVDVGLIDLDKSLFDCISQIYPRNNSKIKELYDGLKSIPNVTVYYKDEVPEEYHYRKSHRIAPIVIEANEGFELNTEIAYYPGGHGYNNSLESMRAIFMARGPDFKINYQFRPVNSIDVYSLLCHLLKINCHPNNGTIDSFKQALTDRDGSNSSSSNFNFKIYLLAILYFIVLILNQIY